MSTQPDTPLLGYYVDVPLNHFILSLQVWVEDKGRDGVGRECMRGCFRVIPC